MEKLMQELDEMAILMKILDPQLKAYIGMWSRSFRCTLAHWVNRVYCSLEDTH